LKNSERDKITIVVVSATLTRFFHFSFPFTHVFQQIQDQTPVLYLL